MASDKFGESLLEVKRQLAGLEEIIQLAGAVDASEAFEDLRRWKGRADRIMQKILTKEESRKFIDQEVRYVNVDPQINLHNNLRHQKYFLNGLIKHLEKYPEDYLIDDEKLSDGVKVPTDILDKNAFRNLVLAKFCELTDEHPAASIVSISASEIADLIIATVEQVETAARFLVGEHLLRGRGMGSRETGNSYVITHAGRVKAEEISKSLEEPRLGDLKVANTQGEINDISINREGVFFRGQYFDALSKIGELIESATSSIEIIDGYVDRRVLSVLSGKNAGVTIRLLTYARPLSSGFLTYAEAFNKQYAGLQIRTSDEFHDRFLIIDGEDLYHIGSSIKDAGNKGFMFSKIEEPSVIAILTKRLEQVWEASKVEI